MSPKKPINDLGMRPLPNWFYAMLVALVLIASVSRGNTQVVRAFDEYLPPGIIMGMGLQEFKTLRPRAIPAQITLKGNGQPNEAFSDFVELSTAIAPFRALAYRFHQGTLGAVELLARPQPAQIANIASAIRVQCLSGFTRAADDSVRLVAKTGFSDLPLEVWSKAGTKAYFGVFTSELRVIVFDPTRVTKEDLFLAVDQLPEEQLSRFRARMP